MNGACKLRNVLKRDGQDTRYFFSQNAKLTARRVLHIAIIFFGAFSFRMKIRLDFLLFINHNNNNKEVIMKFMVSWRIHPDKRQAAFTAFSQMTAEDDKKDLGEKIRLIGRWHDLSQFSGVAICESDDPMALAGWALNWNSVLDVETVMVLDDEEARAVGRKKLEELASAKPAATSN